MTHQQIEILACNIGRLEALIDLSGDINTQNLIAKVIHDLKSIQNSTPSGKVSQLYGVRFVVDSKPDIIEPVDSHQTVPLIAPDVVIDSKPKPGHPWRTSYKDTPKPSQDVWLNIDQPDKNERFTWVDGITPDIIDKFKRSHFVRQIAQDLIEGMTYKEMIVKHHLKKSNSIYAAVSRIKKAIADKKLRQGERKVEETPEIKDRMIVDQGAGYCQYAKCPTKRKEMLKSQMVKYTTPDGYDLFFCTQYCLDHFLTVPQTSNTLFNSPFEE